MKYLAVFLILLGAVFGEPAIRTWTSYELLRADVAPDLKPYTIEATNTLMAAFWLDEVKPTTHALLLSPSGKTLWTVEEITKGENDSNIPVELRVPALNLAVRQIKMDRKAGKTPEPMEINVLVLDISTWTLADLNDSDKYTNSRTAWQPYLEKARKELTEEKKDKVHIITPYGLLKSRSGHSELIPKIQYH